MNKKKKRFREDIASLEKLRSEREILIQVITDGDPESKDYETAIKRVRELTEIISITEKSISANAESKATRGEKAANIAKIIAITGLTAYGLKNAVTVDRDPDAFENKSISGFARSLWSKLF